MSRSSVDEWERRKWYLTRSLFEEVPLLSPIPESQELSLVPPTPTIKEAADKRPHSPLPDLIIEKEPNRHDDPKEYYVDLERKIMKYYRQLFCDTTHTTQFLVTSELEDDNRLISDSESYKEFEHCINDGEGTCNNEDPSETHLSKEPSKFSYQEFEIFTEQEKTSNDEELDIESESSDKMTESRNNKVIIIEAQVHCADNEGIDIDTHKPTVVLRGRSSKIAKYSNDNDTGDINELSGYNNLNVEDKEQEYESSSNYDQDSKSLCSDRATNVSSSPLEVEVMRRRKTSSTFSGSIQGLNVGRYCSADIITEKSLKIANDRDMENAQESSPELSIILGTTPSLKMIRPVYDSQPQSRKRTDLTETSSPHVNRTSLLKRKLDNESNWEEIKREFFVGNPIIFKLYSQQNCHE